MNPMRLFSTTFFASSSRRRFSASACLLAAFVLVGCADRRQASPLAPEPMQEPIRTSSASSASSGSPSVAPGTPQDFEINVGDRVFFAVNRSSLSSEAQETLARQAAWMLRNPSLAAVIEGHADERGTREYNLALSARRAEAVRSHLASRGVPPERLRVIAYGKERPAALCDAEACWSQNRRGVTVIDGARGSASGG